MPARALLIGLDSLDPRTAAALIAEGVMPNAAALRQASTCAPIENYPGLGAGAYWPSAATGVTPGVHGRYFRQQFDKQSYEVGFRDDHTDFHVDAIWHRLDQEGFRIAVIDWQHGPVRAVGQGFILNDWLAHDPAGRFRSLPEGLAAEVARDYGVDPWPGGALAFLPRTADEWRAFVAAAISRIEMKTRFCVDRLRGGSWDLFAPTFCEAHDIGHYALHLSDKDHPAHDRVLAAEVGDPMRPVCAALDRAIAALIAAAGPGAAVMALGGPGMTPLVSGNGMMELIARRLDCGMGATAQATAWAQSRYRSWIPYWLRRALSPITRRALGKPPQRPALADRRFFAVPHTHNSGAIRVNLKGREAYGVVGSGAEYDALLDEISHGMMGIKDADTGAPIVERVVRTKDVLDGPAAGDLPDLFVIWRRDAPFRRIASPQIGVIENGEFVRTGDHTPHGFFWSPRGRADGVGEAGALRPHEVAALVGAAVRGDRAAPAAFVA